MGNESSTEASVPPSSPAPATEQEKATEAAYCKYALEAIEKNDIPKIDIVLTNLNYKDWLFRVKTVFCFFKSSKFLTGFRTNIDDLNENKYYKRCHSIMLNVILESLSTSEREKYLNISSIHDLMQKLDSQFSGSNLIQSQKFLNQLYSLMNSNNDNLDKFVSDFRRIRNTYNQICESKKSDIWKCVLLNCLSDRHNHLKSVLIANPNLTLNDYFNIINQEHLLFNLALDVKATNNIAKRIIGIQRANEK